MYIASPICTGNGAYVVHKVLESRIDHYRVRSYHPYWTLFPFVLPFFRDSKAALVHTTPDYAPFVKTSGARLIVTFHNYVLDPFMRPYSSLLQNIHYQTDLKWFIKKALVQADIVTSVSHFTAKVVRQKLGYTGHIRVIENGIDTNIFTPCRRKSTSSETIHVLFSGNLTLRKGAQWLPDIADRVNSNVRILYTQGLRTRRTMPSHPRLQSIGSLVHSKMPELYGSVDMLLMPTVREGMSLAVLESMSCGLPVVATNCSSTPELIVEGKGGFLCELGNVDDFAEKINQLANSPELRREMGEFNRARVESLFTEERMIREYLLLFEEVMDTC